MYFDIFDRFRHPNFEREVMIHNVEEFNYMFHWGFIESYKITGWVNKHRLYSVIYRLTPEMYEFYEQMYEKDSDLKYRIANMEQCALNFKIKVWNRNYSDAIIIYQPYDPVTKKIIPLKELPRLREEQKIKFDKEREEERKTSRFVMVEEGTGERLKIPTYYPLHLYTFYFRTIFDLERVWFDDYGPKLIISKYTRMFDREKINNDWSTYRNRSINDRDFKINWLKRFEKERHPYRKTIQPNTTNYNIQQINNP